MTLRLLLITIVAAALFGAGFALARPQERPAGGTRSADAAPQELDLQRVDVEAGLAAGAPAPLHRPPVRRRPARPRRRATPAPAPVVAVSQPTVVPTAVPQPVSTPAPTPRPVVVTPAPQAPVQRAPAPAPRPAPRPAPPPPPSYVGSGFDDSG